jgi:hypothetical protein
LRKRSKREWINGKAKIIGYRYGKRNKGRMERGEGESKRDSGKEGML